MGVALVSNFLIIMQNTVDSSPEKCQGNRPDTNCIFFARAPDCTGFQQIAPPPKSHGTRTFSHGRREPGLGLSGGTDTPPQPRSPMGARSWCPCPHPHQPPPGSRPVVVTAGQLTSREIILLKRKEK